MAKRARDDGSPLVDNNSTETTYAKPPIPGWELVAQGAEGRVWGLMVGGRPAVAKERFAKSYRHAQLDAKITKTRLLGEARCLVKARRGGLDTPALLMVDLEASRIVLERVMGPSVKARLRELHAEGTAAARTPSTLSSAASTGSGAIASSMRATAESSPYGAEGFALARALGAAIARLHNCEVIHGDLTTSNMMLRAASFPLNPAPVTKRKSSDSGVDPAALCVIDFGLSSVSQMHEDKAVDLYVMERAFLSTHAESRGLVDEVLRVYKADAVRSDAVMQKLAAVRLRGRKRECFG